MLNLNTYKRLKQKLRVIESENVTRPRFLLVSKVANFAKTSGTVTGDRGKNWPIADGRAPCDDPRSPCEF